MITGFNVKSGILDSKHRNQIGAAIWEFLWCIDRTTSEYQDEHDDTWGVVLGGKPIKADEITEVLGTHPETVKKNLRRLNKNGYLSLKRTPYGYIIHVAKSLKWRPKAKKEPEKKADKPGFTRVFEQEFGRLMSPTELQIIQSYITDGLTDELVCEAIKRARIAGIVTVKYVTGILNKWVSSGIKTMTQVEIADQEFEKQKSQGDKSKGQARGPTPEGEKKKDKFKSLYLS